MTYVLSRDVGKGSKKQGRRRKMYILCSGAWLYDREEIHMLIGVMVRGLTGVCGTYITGIRICCAVSSPLINVRRCLSIVSYI